MTNLTPMQIATRRHAAADTLTQGTYGRMNGAWRGCSVGCLAHDLEPDWTGDDILMKGHARVAKEYVDGQEWLVQLQDTVFEGLPGKDERARWHTDLADAIAVRSRDWQTILHSIHVAILRISLRNAGEAAGAVQAVIDLHEKAARGKAVSNKDWRAAWRVATENAAWGAAWSADGATERVAWNVAWCAAGAMGSMGWDAAWGAAFMEIATVVLHEVQKPE